MKTGGFPKRCVQCGTDFLASGPSGMYCSKSCGQKYRYTNNMRTTAYQYSLASGNWRKYYTRRRAEKGRGKSVTTDELLAIHDRQNGRCALTGVEMTCRLERGEPCFTNASLDRKNPGGPYTADNIQLVCVGVNRFRANLPLDEYVEWCQRVVDYHKQRSTL